VSFKTIVSAAVLLAKRYSIGIRCHWRRTFGWALAAWGATWLAVESLTFLIPPFKEFVDSRNWTVIGFFMLISLLVVVWRLPVQLSTSFRIPTTNTTVEILFDDFFQCRGHWAIPVNEFFDGQTGHLVSLYSVHGQFIQRVFQDDATGCEAAIDEALVGKKSRVKQGRLVARNRSYPTGTTAVLDSGGRKAFLFVATATDLHTAKSQSNVAMMWEALEGLWKEVRAHSGGDQINIPLVGSGRAGIGLEPIHLLRLILISLLVATREAEITKAVRIVLHESMLDRIDLREIHAEWR
jgi:Domain of unknown function (DUF6430)